MAPRGSHIVRLGDDEYRVDVAEGGEVRVEGVEGTFHVLPQADGTCLVTRRPSEGSTPDPHPQWRVFAIAGGDRRQVFVDGEVYDLQVEAAGRPRRAPAHPQVEMLTVPMPARVVKILVSPGQVVRRGDVVVKLEAMKMELPLRAPRDGTVRAVDCREGDLVQPGASVLEIA